MPFHGRRSGVNEAEEDWEVITADWWHTPFMAVSWAYEDPAGEKKSSKRRYHGSLHEFGLRTGPLRLYERRGSSREHDNDTSLNEDLTGVKCSMEPVVAYEKDVGFAFEGLPELTPYELDPDAYGSRLRRYIDEEELKVNKEKWDDLLEDLMHGLVSETTESDESLESSFSSLGDLLHRCASALSSIDLTSSNGSIDSLVLPSTPKAKPSYHNIDIKETSPSDMSPGRSLNASASSFVPTFSHDDNLHFPSLRDTTKSPSSFSSFTFPTLNSSVPTPLVKIKKDDQGFFTEVQAESTGSGLLPPFLQEPTQRGTRSRKSRTREIVDRLRSQVTPDGANLNVTSPKYASHSPSPMMEDLGSSFMLPRRSVSEDGGDVRPSGFSTPSPCEDEDGWIDIANPVNNNASTQKSKRTRELFLALTRRRTDSLSSEAWRELIGEDNGDTLDSEQTRPRSSSPSPSKRTSLSTTKGSNPPVVSSDGWIESTVSTPAGLSSDLPTVPSKVHTQKAVKGNGGVSKESHTRKKSHNPSAWSRSSNSPTSQPIHHHAQQQPLHLTQPFTPGVHAHHPHGHPHHAHAHHAHSLSHPYTHAHPHAHPVPVPIPVQQMPYFLPTYPPVPMAMPYPAFNVMHPHAPTHMAAYPMATHTPSAPYAVPSVLPNSAGKTVPAAYSVRHSSGGVLVSTKGLLSGTGAPGSAPGGASVAAPASSRTKHATPVHW